jgi:hypothetical protein
LCSPKELISYQGGRAEKCCLLHKVGFSATVKPGRIKTCSSCSLFFC